MHERKMGSAMESITYRRNKNIHNKVTLFSALRPILQAFFYIWDCSVLSVGYYTPVRIDMLFIIFFFIIYKYYHFIY